MDSKKSTPSGYIGWRFGIDPWVYKFVSELFLYGKIEWSLVIGHWLHKQTRNKSTYQTTRWNWVPGFVFCAIISPYPIQRLQFTVELGNAQFEKCQ
jgi:hypothetical protein